MAYAMYLRKSRKDDDTGIEDTLARHEKMLQDLADRMGILVCEQDVYREVVSGESIEARPQMPGTSRDEKHETGCEQTAIEPSRIVPALFEVR